MPLTCCKHFVWFSLLTWWGDWGLQSPNFLSFLIPIIVWILIFIMLGIVILSLGNTEMHLSKSSGFKSNPSCPHYVVISLVFCGNKDWLFQSVNLSSPLCLSTIMGTQSCRVLYLLYINESLTGPLRRKGQGWDEGEMVGWHHQLNGHEFEQGPGVSDRQGSLACCSPWGCRATSQWSNWTELNWGSLRRCSLPAMNSFYNLNRLTFLRMGSPSARYGKWIWQRDELIILIFFGLEYSGGASGKEPACHCRGHSWRGLDLGVR